MRDKIVAALFTGVSVGLITTFRFFLKEKRFSDGILKGEKKEEKPTPKVSKTVEPKDRPDINQWFQFIHSQF